LASGIIGLIVGLAVLITLLSTFDIRGSWHPVLRESTIITQLLRAIWVIAFLYDLAIVDLAGLSDDVHCERCCARPLSTSCCHGGHDQRSDGSF
jgi:hypothetical protein